MSVDYASLAGEYAFDPAHTRVGFVARHAMVTKIRGAFNDFEGKIVIDGDRPEISKAEVTVKVASVDTRNEQRNAHLLSGDFFEQDRYPLMTFTSAGVTELNDGKFVLRGDLTVKDVTRPVAFDAEYLGAAVDPYGNHRIGFEATTTVSRKDFGMTWNAAVEAGGVLVSDKIQIELEVSAIRQA